MKSLSGRVGAQVAKRLVPPWATFQARSLVAISSCEPSALLHRIGFPEIFAPPWAGYCMGAIFIWTCYNRFIWLKCSYSSPEGRVRGLAICEVSPHICPKPSPKADFERRRRKTFLPIATEQGMSMGMVRCGTRRQEQRHPHPAHMSEPKWAEHEKSPHIQLTLGINGGSSP